MVTGERADAAEGMFADGGDESAASLTGVAAELFAPDDGEASARGEPENGTDADTDEDGAAPDPHLAWLESDEGQRVIRKVADRFTKNELRTLYKAIDGDEGARQAAQSNREMRRLLSRIEQQRATDVVQEVDGFTRAQARYDELSRMSDWELRAEEKRLPGTIHWFDTTWPNHLRGEQDKRQSPSTRTAVSDGENPLEEAYDALLEDDDAEGLTDDERALFSPEKYADLAPSKALAAMNRDARKAFAQAAKRVESAPVRARTAALNRATAAVAAGAAKSPPSVGGTPPPRGQTFEQIRDEYREARRNDALTPQLRAKYEAATKRQFGR